MQPKRTNLDSQIEQAVEAMKTEGSTLSSQDQALQALLAERPAKPRLTPITLRLAGVAATAAFVVALAAWPRPGQALPWSQVAEKVQRAERLHEVVEVLNKNKKWEPNHERWTDGVKYASVFRMKGKVELEMRFNGKRAYRYNGFSHPYTVVQTVTDPKLYQDSGRELASPLGMGAVSIDKLVGDGNARLTYRAERPLANGNPGYEYGLEIKELKGSRYETLSKIKAFVDAKSGRIDNWIWSRSDSATVYRGRVEFPTSIDPKVFEAPSNPPAPLFDLDRSRNEVADSLRNGIGTVRAGGSTATVRAVLLSISNDLTILWTGASPNGDLAQPIVIDGSSMKPVSYGIKQFTTSRALPGTRYEPSLLGEPLGGMTIRLSEKARKPFTLKIPIYVEDRSNPIRGKSGKVVGFRSRFVGYDTLRNVKPLRITNIYNYGDLLGLHKMSPHGGILPESKPL